MATIKTTRIPVVAPIVTREVARAGNVTTDSYLINCYTETLEDGRKLVVKRPGLTQATTYNGGGATNGQGTFFFKGSKWAIGSNVIYRLDSSPNGSASGATWTASTAAPWKGRDRFGCIVFNGSIFVIAGENAGGFAFLNDVWSSPDGINWTQVVSAAPWAARCEFGLAILGTTMYLLGGRGNGTGFNDVWATPDGVNWTQVVGTAPWSTRYGFGCVAFNQGIFVMGGNSGGLDLNDVWFSPDGATWTQMVAAATWSIRSRFNCIVYAGKIWILGGFNTAGGVNLQSVYSSPNGITWTNTGNLPALRSEMCICVYSNTIFMVGGSPGTTTVWSTTDGTSFTVVTGAYGGAVVQGGALIPLRTPTSVSTIQAITMWLIGGFGVGFTNNIFRAALDVAMAASFSPTTSATTTEQWQTAFQNAGDYLIAKNTKDAWVIHSGIMQQITSTNYPTLTVSGIANLDDTVYVMDVNGVIYGSNLSTPFDWSSLNFITADFEADVGVRIIKYQNYILALKASTYQILQDAGRYPGSPLLPVVSYNTHVGCASANTVVAMRNTVVWVAKSESSAPYVVFMEGANATRISTPSVERVLGDWLPSASDTATFIRWNGHDVYIVTLASATLTLAYDFMEQRWYFLRSGTGFPAIFNGTNYVTDGSFDYFQHPTLGILYTVRADVYQDAGASINVVIQVPKIDFGTSTKKFVGGVELIGDQLASSSPNNVQVLWSDDDGQTLYTGGLVDLTSSHPYLPRGGSFRRRIYTLVHSSNNPLRLEALGLNVIGG